VGFTPRPSGEGGVLHHWHLVSSAVLETLEHGCISAVSSKGAMAFAHHPHLLPWLHTPIFAAMPAPPTSSCNHLCAHYDALCTVSMLPNPASHATCKDGKLNISAPGALCVPAQRSWAELLANLHAPSPRPLAEGRRFGHAGN